MLILALLACAYGAYDFSKPENGNELKATLKDEKDNTFVVFFRADKYPTATDEDKRVNELIKNITDEIRRKCTDQGLKDTDYTWIDVEIELDGIKEKNAKKNFGKLLQDLGFEEVKAAPAPAAGGAAPAAAPAPAAPAPAPAAGAPAAAAPAGGAAASTTAAPAAELPKL